MSFRCPFCSTITKIPATHLCEKAGTMIDDEGNEKKIDIKMEIYWNVENIEKEI